MPPRLEVVLLSIETLEDHVPTLVVDRILDPVVPFPNASIDQLIHLVLDFLALAIQRRGLNRTGVDLFCL